MRWAAIAFWLLTRRFPEIHGDMGTGTVVRDIQHSHPQFSPEAATVIESMLRFHRDRRCSNAANAVERLALLVLRQPTCRRSASPRGYRRRLWWSSRSREKARTNPPHTSTRRGQA